MFPFEFHDPLGSLDGLSLMHPLMSQPLVELCMRYPTYVLTAGGRDRALARHAFSADLPREIIRRRSKGGQEEYLKEILTRNLPFVRELLLDGLLVQHGTLNRANLEAVQSGEPTSIAGEQTRLHSLIGAEAWLRRWREIRDAILREQQLLPHG